MNRQRILSLVPLTAALVLAVAALVGSHWLPRMNNGTQQEQTSQMSQMADEVATQAVTALPALPGTIVELRYSPAGRAVTLRLDHQEIGSLWQDLSSWSGLRLVEVTRSENHWTVTADLWPVGTSVPQLIGPDTHGTAGPRTFVSAFLPLSPPLVTTPGPAGQPPPPGPSRPEGRTGVVRFSGGHPMLWRWNETVLSLEAP